MKIRNFGKIVEAFEMPNLVEIQTNSYSAFLQEDVPPGKRKDQGLEAILREAFPIKNYDETLSLEYIKYELGKPRYSADECRQLKLIYGKPLRVWLRLNRESPVEEEVYLGEIPVMIGGGEFVINGTERVIVNQLHRSPGVDFSEEMLAEKRMHSCRIIPERGSWIEIEVGKKDVLNIRVDQSGKFPATCFLRAMSEDFSDDADIIRLFYETETIPCGTAGSAAKLIGRFAVSQLIDPQTGEVLLDAGKQITESVVKLVIDLGVEEFQVIKDMDDPLILNTLETDYTDSHEDALLKIYSRFRPGNPQHLDKAKQLFYDKFFDYKRYRLGLVGRFRLNRKLNQDLKADEMALCSEDFINSIKYIIGLRNGKGSVDDIDHLGNRRLRTIDELFGEELRKGFLKLRRTVQERMNVKDHDQLTPRILINSRTIFSTIEYFFSRGELSQVLDQTNPLAQLTHERRLSALGPGGLNRKRAGFDVRDVHLSHYGRICPIETPEGTNIGLIASLTIFATVDSYGFLTTPYMKVEKGKLTNEFVSLRADEEENKVLAPADSQDPFVEKGSDKELLARCNGDFLLVKTTDVDYIDVSPKQLVGVSTSLIPFLEHSDANRALMGANMQRQAVPLLQTEPPLIATGMEKVVARNSSMVVCAKNNGVVSRVDARQIELNGNELYTLRKNVGLNEGTCLNHKPIVKEGQKVKKGEVIADGAATFDGELSLGKNVLVAFMTWDGYNFEDAIVVSESLLRGDKYTSVHRDEFEVEVRETTLGREEFTRDIPNVSERALSNLDENGIIRVGTKVKPSDILVGKIAPKSRSELSPEEKLLHAIFGRAGEDVKNVSLEVPSGIEGVVIDTKLFSRRAHLSEDKRQKIVNDIKEVESTLGDLVAPEFIKMVQEITDILGGPLTDLGTGQPLRISDETDVESVLALQGKFDLKKFDLGSNLAISAEITEVCEQYQAKFNSLKEEANIKISQLKRGDELPSGVLEVAKVSIATKRRLSVGDKMAGRHGNKGVIAKILPVEDMPFLEDGTPVEMVLNPLGVPSRMNLGQLLETHLGWASKKLGFQSVTPIFDGAKEADVISALQEAGLPTDGKATLFDGRTGEPFQQKVTVGYMYMLKLHHLVDEKVHARATGPYSLITQQPLGGKARFGGQRFGEMEVWALEAYGAAYNLQELLTVKSDDVEGRTRIYESMIKGNNTLEAGTPASFEVLSKEIEGLGLSLKLEKETTL
ncbi:MAG: DNA-directed RNA polymerase subunit beta [Candidatus Scalindua sp. AMX11]|nr:MAG: DNA-directed RNA polymerase subunit beta [Candidatus Scalindua sp.]NOG85480.1 DNA-directed RNA polymerase subunit beta [Planctomycetota bacterium]RZV90270.1 MAG: DNA-directed RNA polymerase subunit beta [Candidatus Scalindua sp. SCAELEC01]TDE64680.1 MAG: DNA-directed RNA polymerase subunit beta [Candidatus Scalindua sp. AMX11]GJQ57368.1 MAG: DNA-directed RNA polymerase subunit beta [Candidatus Scalindua sp.]